MSKERVMILEDFPYTMWDEFDAKDFMTAYLDYKHCDISGNPSIIIEFGNKEIMFDNKHDLKDFICGLEVVLRRIQI